MNNIYNINIIQIFIQIQKINVYILYFLIYNIIMMKLRIFDNIDFIINLVGCSLIGLTILIGPGGSTCLE